jgi:GMP synthase (glutamine-hydrolysing)
MVNAQGEKGFLIMTFGSMDDPRPKSRLLVQAIVRRCQSRGVPAFQTRRGDPDAGAIFLKLNGLGAGCVVLFQVRTGTGEAAWARATGSDPVDERRADDYLERQARIDPDAWVVEIEDPTLTPPVDTPVL